MPFCPFFCPFMNDSFEDDADFRSPNGFQPPQFPGQAPGQGPGGGPPSGPPPAKTPTLKSSSNPSLKAVDPGAIRLCKYQFVYIWPTYGRPFWAWLTYVGPHSAAGFRWNGYSWRYFGIDLKQIGSFECY
jgi:hypothetical protein